MGSIPAHPFFLLVIESLKKYDKNWKLPYVTVMYSTGPLFLSVIWKKFMASGKNVGDSLGGGRVRVLMQDEYNRHPWSFFSHHKGSSWHGKDARFVFWLGGHWMLITVAGFLLAGVVGLGLWWLYGRILMLGQRGRGGERRGGIIGGGGGGGGGGVGVVQGLMQIGGWRKQSQKEYELLQRHEV